MAQWLLKMLQTLLSHFSTHPMYLGEIACSNGYRPIYIFIRHCRRTIGACVTRFQFYFNLFPFDGRACFESGLDFVIGQCVCMCQSIDRVCCERTHMRQPLFNSIFVIFRSLRMHVRLLSIHPATSATQSQNAQWHVEYWANFIDSFHYYYGLRRGTFQHEMSMRKLLKNSKQIYIQTHETWSSFRVTPAYRKKSLFFFFFATMFAPQTFIFRITANWSISIEWMTHK